jgi:hypothetical protein
MDWPFNDGSESVLQLSYLFRRQGKTVSIETFKHDEDFIFHIAFLGYISAGRVPLLRSRVVCTDACGTIQHGFVQRGSPSSKYSSSYFGLKVSHVGAFDDSYRVRISAQNKMGFGNTSTSDLIEVAKFRPSAPTSVALGTAYDLDSLTLTFKAPLSDGGRTITKFLVEWHSNPEISSFGLKGGWDEINLYE